MHTLKDAVLGDVTNSHVSALTVADDDLRDGLKQIETWGPRVVESFPGGADSFDLSDFRTVVSSQRELLRSFRSLVQQGTQSKQVFLRATPWKGAVAVYPGYERYVGRANRVIPLFRLVPEEPGV